MEAEIAVVCQFGDQTLPKIFGEFLGEDTRPLDEDDVEDQYVPVFERLDEIDSPEWLKVHEDKGQFHAWWFLGGEWYEAGQKMIKHLINAGVHKCCAALFVDGEIDSLYSADRRGQFKVEHDTDLELDEETVFQYLSDKAV